MEKKYTLVLKGFVADKKDIERICKYYKADFEINYDGKAYSIYKFLFSYMENKIYNRFLFALGCHFSKVQKKDKTFKDFYYYKISEDVRNKRFIERMKKQGASACMIMRRGEPCLVLLNV